MRPSATAFFMREFLYTLPQMLSQRAVTHHSPPEYPTKCQIGIVSGEVQPVQSFSTIRNTVKRACIIGAFDYLHDIIKIFSTLPGNFCPAAVESRIDHHICY